MVSYMHALPLLSFSHLCPSRPVPSTLAAAAPPRAAHTHTPAGVVRLEPFLGLAGFLDNSSKQFRPVVVLTSPFFHYTRGKSRAFGMAEDGRGTGRGLASSVGTPLALDSHTAVVEARVVARWRLDSNRKLNWKESEKLQSRRRWDSNPEEQKSRTPKYPPCYGR